MRRLSKIKKKDIYGFFFQSKEQDRRINLVDGIRGG